MMEISDIVSTIEKEYIINLLKKGKRIDGRGLYDFREISVEIDFSPKSEGSADIRLGKTRIMCGVKYDIGAPFPDTPDMGVATCMAEFIPFASPMFESGPPSMQAIELARVVDRGIRHGNSIDYKKLSIIDNKLVYIIFIDLYIMDYYGNLTDAGNLAAIIALISAKIPTAKILEDNENVEWDGGYQLLPINQLPISITFGKIGDYVFIDPTLPEELCQEGSLSITIEEKGNICSIQKSGIATWESEEIIKYSKLAIEKSNELRNKLNLRQYTAKL